MNAPLSRTVPDQILGQKTARVSRPARAARRRRLGLDTRAFGLHWRVKRCANRDTQVLYHA